MKLRARSAVPNEDLTAIDRGQQAAIRRKCSMADLVGMAAQCDAEFQLIGSVRNTLSFPTALLHRFYGLGRIPGNLATGQGLLECRNRFLRDRRPFQVQLLELLEAEEMDKTRARDIGVLQGKPLQLGQLPQILQSVVSDINCAVQAQLTERADCCNVRQALVRDPGAEREVTQLGHPLQMKQTFVRNVARLAGFEEIEELNSADSLNELKRSVAGVDKTPAVLVLFERNARF